MKNMMILLVCSEGEHMEECDSILWELRVKRCREVIILLVGNEGEQMEEIHDTSCVF